MGWHQVHELLEAGQYKRVAALLREAQAAYERTANWTLADTCSVAIQICLACIQCQTEVKWHQHACDAADQREQELRHQLQIVLDRTSQHKMPETPTVESRHPEPVTPESGERASLRQRIQALLGWGPGVRSREGRTLSLSVEAEAPTAPSADEIETQTDATAEVLAAPPSVAESQETTVSSTEGERQGAQNPPSLSVYCLGPFRVYQDEQPIRDWPSSKGKCIFKYLIMHRERPAAKEVLMERFWPAADPDAARNNLNVAIYGLRQALRQTRPSFSHVLFQDDCYLLNPDLHIWVDSDEFRERFRTGQILEQRGELALALREYRAAEFLYQGEFFEEDRYADWLFAQRQRLQDYYLSLLDRLSRIYLDQEDFAACVGACQKMLAIDSCREEAHRRLMCCYSRQGQPYLALRQYHLCAEKLKEELDVSPTERTELLYQRVRKGRRI
jgi:DNA-binding SARP family transcriptional activator